MTAVAHVCELSFTRLGRGCITQPEDGTFPYSAATRVIADFAEGLG